MHYLLEKYELLFILTYKQCGDTQYSGNVLKWNPVESK